MSTERQHNRSDAEKVKEIVDKIISFARNEGYDATLFASALMAILVMQFHNSGASFEEYRK